MISSILRPSSVIATARLPLDFQLTYRKVALQKLCRLSLPFSFDNLISAIIVSPHLVLEL